MVVGGFLGCWAFLGVLVWGLFFFLVDGGEVLAVDLGVLQVEFGVFFKLIVTCLHFFGSFFSYF